MDIAEMARHYFLDYDPPLWDKDRFVALLKAGKLSREDFKEITGEYPELST